MTDDFQIDHRLDDLIEGLWRVLGDRGLSRETKIEETIRVSGRMERLDADRSAPAAFLDGTNVTPGTEGCVCGPECEFPCWQRLGLTSSPCCSGCAPLVADALAGEQ